MTFLSTLIIAMSTAALPADISNQIDDPLPIVAAIEQPAEIEQEDVKSNLSATPIVKDVACNCYNLLRESFDSVPPMDHLLSTAKTSHKNPNVAVFKYPMNEDWPDGIPHVALVHEVLPDGSITIEEYNYHSCAHSVRTIPPDYHRLVGFHHL